MLISILAAAAALSTADRGDIDAVLKTLRGRPLESVVAELGPPTLTVRADNGVFAAWETRAPLKGMGSHPPSIVTCSLRLRFNQAEALRTWSWKGSARQCQDLVARIAAARPSLPVAAQP